MIGVLKILFVSGICVAVYYIFIQLKVLYCVFSTRPAAVKNKTVVISGCDSGFGRLLAERLDSMGVNVIALCLKKEHQESLIQHCSKRLRSHLLDLRDTENIDNVCSEIKNDNVEIYGLVNNAGVLDGSYIEFTDLKVYREMMEVNYFGPVYLTKKLIPFISPGGRIVNLLSNLVFTSSPNFSAYSGSKYAFRAFSEALRKEMAFREIQVSCIEPGYHETNLCDKLLNNTIEEIKQKQYFDHYGGERFYKAHKSISELYIQSIKFLNGGNPKRVVDALQDALFSSFSLNHYIIGIDSIVFWILGFLPDVLSDTAFRVILPQPCR